MNGLAVSCFIFQNNDHWKSLKNKIRNWLFRERERSNKAVVKLIDEKCVLKLVKSVE